MLTTLTSTVFLSILLVLTSMSEAKQQDSDVPHLPLPRYNNDGSVEFLPRIVNGTAAYLGEFPGTVSIQNRQGAHFCGGTIVDTRHIVTAAHCVTNSRGQLTNPTTVQIMGDDLSITRQGSSSRQVRLVSHIFVHTGYNVISFINDIAVIRLASPFVITSTFYTVQRSATTPPENMVCRVAGWGATFEDGDASARLLRVDLPIVNTNTCNRAFGGRIKSPGMICAGYLSGGRDTCQGDSGGGLICNNLLAGIVSFGYGCARPNFPGVYTDVRVYNAFIDFAMNWNGGPQSAVPVPTTLRPSAASTTVTSMYMLGLTLLVFMVSKL